MPMRHAQRKHIIHSLSSLLYQLHTISFLLSPRFWPLLCRIATQFQFSRPRDIDSQRSLRFWFILVLLVNLQSFYNDGFRGPAGDRSIILDFVGMAHKPSKAFLLFLDFIIVFLEFVLITIAYETSFQLAMPPDTPDPLQPESIPATPPSPLTFDSPSAKQVDFTSYENEPEYIIDLRLRCLFQRLRHPPPPPLPQQTNLSGELLPLPNTTSFQLSRSLNMLMRARAQMRERAARAPEIPQTSRPPAADAARPREQEGERDQGMEESRRLPGGLGGEDDL